MRIRFIGLVLGIAVVLGLGLLAAPPASANVAACPTVLPALTPRPAGAPQSVQAQFAPGPGDTSYHLTDPCGGMFAMPPFQGVSPLSITSVPGMCNWGYGDIGVWQAGGHSYVVLSGFGLVMFHIFNVDDPYHPVALITQPFPANGTASTSVFPFQQNGHRYISVTMRGVSAGCGWFLYNVDDPAHPLFMSRTDGADWCTVHEHFVSTDSNGNADYAWLTMSAEAESGFKIVVLDIRNLPQIVETGRYERPDAGGSIFAHDVTVVGNRVFVADWGGGLIIHDKNTLAHNTNPTPLNPIDSIRPPGFSVHQAWPTSDGNHVFIEDEYNNDPTSEKIRLYNIANVAAPYYEGGIIGPDTAANNRAHNMKILNLSPGHDLLLDGWYEAGTRGFLVDTTGTAPRITATLSHQLRETTDGEFGDVWGVDTLPCTVHGQAKTCLYSSDMAYGLVVDALGEDPSLDPYPPESHITDPLATQTLSSCNTYTIHGTADDYYSGVTGVEVSTDNGNTWWPAQGTTNWTFDWTIPGDGTYTLLSRARDAAFNLEQPTSGVIIIVNGCTVTTVTPPPSYTPLPSDTPTGTPTGTSTATPTRTMVPPTATASTTPTVCTIQFADVPSSNPFYSYIRCLACQGILNGYSTTPPCVGGTPCFQPGAGVTRGQAAKIVVNAAGYTDPIPSGQQTFTDVPGSNPFWLYVERAALHSVMSGYTANPACSQVPCFLPFADVTRGQLAKIAANAAGLNSPVPTTQQTFEDVPPTNPFWAYVERLAPLQVISGYQCNQAPGEPCVAPTNRPYFRGGNPVTRGQAAKVVANTFFPGCAIPQR